MLFYKFIDIDNKVAGDYELVYIRHVRKHSGYHIQSSANRGHWLSSWQWNFIRKLFLLKNYCEYQQNLSLLVKNRHSNLLLDIVVINVISSYHFFISILKIPTIYFRTVICQLRAVASIAKNHVLFHHLFLLYQNHLVFGVLMV